jgi:hypothetical protein
MSRNLQLRKGVERARIPPRSRVPLPSGGFENRGNSSRSVRARTEAYVEPDEDVSFEQTDDSVLPSIETSAHHSTTLDAQKVIDRILEEFPEAREDDEDVDMDRPHSDREWEDVADHENQFLDQDENALDLQDEFEDEDLDETVIRDSITASPPESQTLTANTPAASTSGPSSMQPPSRRPSAPHIDLTEEEIHTPKKPFFSKFLLAFSLFIQKTGLSRKHYKALLEVLQLAQSLDEFRKPNIPTFKDTLLKQLNSQLPLLKLRKRKLKLDSRKLPTRLQNAEEEILTFDMKDTFQTMLQSEGIEKARHIGMAEIVDDPQELWHTRCWGESSRTTSGQFAVYPNRKPILPSDFVRFKCKQQSCHCNVRDPLQYGHFGRVTFVGVDKRPDSSTKDQVLLRTQAVTLRNNDLLLRSYPRAPSNQTELVIVEDVKVYLEPEQIVLHVPETELYLDYQWDFDPSKRPARQKPVPFRPEKLIIRYILNNSQQAVRLLQFTPPHRGELEIRQFGRRWIEENMFSTPHTNFKHKIVSLPYTLFADGFGLYRGRWRSTMGIYILPAFFPEELRNRRANVLPITLGPFGSALADVLDSMIHLAELDKGVEIQVNGEPVFLCAPNMAFVGDMPQQDELSGTMQYNANYPCRSCLIHRKERSNLDFDIVKRGRYHTQMTNIRNASKSTTAPKQKEKLLREIGLESDDAVINACIRLFPCLDIFRSRPADAAHSEFKGISKEAHKMLFDGILSTDGKRSFTTALQQIRPPPGWSRLSSPLVHLKSWEISEFARGSILTPVVLREYINGKDLVPEFAQVLLKRIHDPAMRYENEEAKLNQAATEVAKAFWQIAKSNMVLTGRRVPVHDRKNLPQIVKQGRVAFQLLAQCLADVCEAKAAKSKRGKQPRVSSVASSRRSSISQQSADGSDRDSRASTVESQDPDEIQTPEQKRKGEGDKAKKWIAKMGLPNVHVGLHWEEVGFDYGTARLMLTLLGEDKHR